MYALHVAHVINTYDPDSNGELAPNNSNVTNNNNGTVSSAANHSCWRRHARVDAQSIDTNSAARRSAAAVLNFLDIALTVMQDQSSAPIRLVTILPKLRTRHD